ncbi:conserved hypothetical protein [Sporisorium reilianum SRZ2]|uniref:Nudix hydrolase domain-containing protein n=1 Tax=Sporisorium reilianum (strain SRZ2) TaxID=999809 RepID=E7A2E8_SPORE|nr:conserved hypothetical protein [Sporisorium reilianum SRZ2]
MSLLLQPSERFAGSQLPASFRWYWDDAERRAFLAADGASSAAKIPSDGYTHTLLFALHTSASGTQLLLGLKLRGFGASTYNGIGGKLLPGETPLTSILRETHEEIHVRLSPQHVHLVGRVTINVDGGENICIAVYTAQFDESMTKQVQQSDEIQPHWFDIGDVADDASWNSLPTQAMRPEHKIYLAPLLHHTVQREAGGIRALIDVHVDFNAEPSKDALAPAERPENHRTVRQWSLDVIHAAEGDTRPT